MYKQLHWLQGIELAREYSFILCDYLYVEEGIDLCYVVSLCGSIHIYTFPPPSVIIPIFSNNPFNGQSHGYLGLLHLYLSITEGVFLHKLKTRYRTTLHIVLFIKLEAVPILFTFFSLEVINNTHLFDADMKGQDNSITMTYLWWISLNYTVARIPKRKKIIHFT
ncbi:hypothetical protein BDB01DRAFT_863549 [Pilobolus umbonatus]|nr:hypothetical protein BDB01DRAFT_863549 [Pilobolus umbonatus]